MLASLSYDHHLVYIKLLLIDAIRCDDRVLLLCYIVVALPLHHDLVAASSLRFLVLATPTLGLPAHLVPLAGLLEDLHSVQVLNCH